MENIIVKDLTQEEIEDLSIVDSYISQHPESAYILQVEVGDMPKDKIVEFCYSLKSGLEQNLGLTKFMIIPTSNGRGRISLLNIKDYVLNKEVLSDATN